MRFTILSTISKPAEEGNHEPGRLHYQFCWIDDALPTATAGKKVRASGPPPAMSDSEVITNETDGEMAPIVLEGTQGLALGDCAYWVPDMQASLRKEGIVLQAPYRTAHPPQAAVYQRTVLGQVPYHIDTVFGQLTDRCKLKRVWARDLWHLRNRILRAILMHTLCIWLNQQQQAPCLQLDWLVV